MAIPCCTSCGDPTLNQLAGETRLPLASTGADEVLHLALYLLEIGTTFTLGAVLVDL